VNKDFVNKDEKFSNFFFDYSKNNNSKNKKRREENKNNKSYDKNIENIIKKNRYVDSLVKFKKICYIKNNKL